MWLYGCHTKRAGQKSADTRLRDKFVDRAVQGGFQQSGVNLRRLHSNRHGCLKVCMSVVSRREYRPNRTAFPSFYGGHGQNAKRGADKKVGAQRKEEGQTNDFGFFRGRDCAQLSRRAILRTKSNWSKQNSFFVNPLVVDLKREPAKQIKSQRVKCVFLFI